MHDPHRPFNDLPDLPPAVELETRRVLKAAIAANRALAELKGVGGTLPDQRVLVNSVILQEARVSSEIENIVTTQDDLYRALDRADAVVSPAAKEVLRYREALWHGYEQLKTRPLCLSLMIDLAAIIQQSEIGIRRVPGVRIASSDGKVVYTPPEGEPLLRAKLANLEQFINAVDDLDPLVKLAVMHYQFEAIHPFTDGNGRTGRILNILYLLAEGLLDLPVLFLSGYVISHKTEYYSGLRRVTEEGAWEDWLLYMMAAVETTARDTRRKVEGIREAMSAATDLVRTSAPRIYSKDLIELIFRQPYCKIRFLEEAGLAQRQTASSYLRRLERLGLLASIKVGREVFYINTPLFAVLSEPTDY